MSKNFTRYGLNRLAIFLAIAIPQFLSAQIITFSPAAGRVGTTVTITGTDFNSTAANNAVYFGAVRAAVVSATATQLVVTVPAGTTYKPLSVTTGGKTVYSTTPFINTFGCSTDLISSSLGEKINFSAGYFSSPISVAIADLDGDGKPEIIITDQDYDMISVFRNTSTHSTLNNTSFAAPVNFETGDGPAGIAIGDIDGDGKPDIAVTNNISSTVSVFRNTSSRGIIDASTLAPQVSLPTSTGPADNAGTANISMGDLDGDGRPEIAVTNTEKNTVSVFRNTSVAGVINSGSFLAKTDLTTGDDPLGLVMADFDGDKKADIAFNNASSGNFSIYRNMYVSGAVNESSFAARANFSTELFSPTVSITAGDLNNDSKPEVIVSNILGNSISIYQNSSSAGFLSFGSRVNFSTPTNPVNAVISDMNGDGKPDIAVMSYDYSASNSNSNPLSLYTSNMANNVTGPTITSSFFKSKVDFIAGGSTGVLGIGDLDADGKPDFAIPNYTSDLVSVYKNTSSIFNALPPATVNGLNSACDDGVWKNLYDPFISNRIICSVRDNGNNLGSINARVYVDAAPVNYNGTYLMARHFLITPTDQPVTPVNIRLYFTVAEFNALKALDSRLASPGNLSITKYQGPTEDGLFNPSDASALTIIPSSSVVFGTAFGGYYADFVVSGLSEFWLNAGTIVLPVELLYFKAEKLTESVLLQWSTASETNNDYFTVERSDDGINFSNLATVRAAEPSAQQRNYEIKDPAPLSGLNYYRLKQTDKDGKSSYSAIKIVDWEGQSVTRVTISPLPVKSTATVSFLAKTGINKLVVYNAQGAAVQTYTINRTANGNAQLTIQKGGLAPGMYFYKIFNTNKLLHTGKLVIE